MQPTALPHASRIRSGQGGSVLIQFAVFLSIIVLILGVVDLGYSFYAKRDLQRIADLAAIEAVQGIDFQAPTSTAACVAAGDQSVVKNWPSPLSQVSKTVVCGEWSSKKYAAPYYFKDNATPLNAAHVVLEGESPSFVPAPWNRNIRAEAIAQRSAPTAAFQIGSQLLNLNEDAPLGKLLTLIGLDARMLTVLDANGLANAKISPSGLLKALGVDLGVDGLSALTPDQLTFLNNLTLLQIMNASLELISDNTLKADINAAIAAIKDLKIGSVKLLDTSMPLLGDSSTGAPGIFTFLSLGKNDSPNGAALDAKVSIGEVLKTAIMIAADGHSLQINDTHLLNTVKLGLTVVEPPTIAVGPIGTKANSAQVRADIDIDSAKIPILGGLLANLPGGGLRINLPVKVESVSADATLTEVYCPDPDRGNQPSIDLGVQSRVAKITIGHPELSGADPQNVLVKTPLSLNVRGPITTSVLEARAESVNLVKGQTETTKENALLLGDTVGSLTDALFSLLGGLFSPPILSSNWQGMGLDGSAQDVRDAQIEMLAKLYLEETKVNGFYKVDDALKLILEGRGSVGSDGYLGVLVKDNFQMSHGIPTMQCLETLGLYACPIKYWGAGTFSASFTALTSKPLGLLNVVGIPALDGGYFSCAGLLSSLVNWNGCVLGNLNNLLKLNFSHVNLTDANALIAALKNKGADTVTCPGVLCQLLKPVLDPVKWLLNGLGEGILSPLLTKVLGLELGRNEVRAIDISCNSAQLVF